MRLTVSVLIIAGLSLGLAGCGGCEASSRRVVVYCAQDEDYAQRLFQAFEARHPLKVAPKFDTEANKSVSLVEELRREAEHPRGDVHWNNEPLGTIRLARAGIYAPYASPAAKGYPAGSQSADQTWHAFAERARVLIVNTSLVAEGDRPRSLLDLTHPRWKGRVAMAKPQFGTTATQVACLFEVLGGERARQFYRDLKANDVAIVPGNKQAATEVSAGRYAVGFTDSDDAILEVLAGKPVTLIFPDAAGHPEIPRMGTLFLPNTLAVIRGGPNPQGAQALIDDLLGPESESMLAAGGGYQFPRGSGATGPSLPALQPYLTAKRMAVDFEKSADLWDEVQAFLRDEFAR